MNDLRYMYKSVAIYDFLMLLVLIAGARLISIKYMLPVIIGLLIAVINFYIGAIVTNTVLTKNKVRLLSLLAFSIKIITPSIIGVIFFAYNKYNLIAYILGFISHFIPLVLYGISLKNK